MSIIIKGLSERGNDQFMELIKLKGDINEKLESRLDKLKEERSKKPKVDMVYIKSDSGRSIGKFDKNKNTLFPSSLTHKQGLTKEDFIKLGKLAGFLS